jgi:uncharacterized protein (DUF486 family)
MFVEELAILRALKSVVGLLVANVRAAWRDERGMTTETAIITAILVGLALALLAAITGVVTNRIGEIERG